MNRSKFPKSILQVCTVAIYAFLYAPIAIIILYSFRMSGQNTQLTLQWYTELFNRSPLINSLFLSVQIAIIVMIITTVLAAFTSFAIARSRWPKNKAAITGYLSIPLILPAIVYAIAFLTFLSNLNLARGRNAIIIGHVIYTFPFAVLVIMGGFSNFNTELEEAAKDLGASRFHTIKEVTIPILTPNIIAASLFAFTLSFDEFIIAFFVGGLGDVTLPMRIWALTRLELSPVIYSISSVILAVSLIVVAIATFYGGRSLFN